MDVSSGVAHGAPAGIAKLSTSGCVKVSSAFVSGTGYHCGSALKLQSGFSSSSAKNTKLGSALWRSSVAAHPSSDESKTIQRMASTRASVEAPAPRTKTAILRSADTAGAVRFLLICITILPQSSGVYHSPRALHPPVRIIRATGNYVRVWALEQFKFT